MKREPIPSERLRAIGYSPCASVLEVEYLDGAVQQFLNVPTSVYDALMGAASRDGFFESRVREHFPSRTIAPEPGEARP